MAARRKAAAAPAETDGGAEVMAELAEQAEIEPSPEPVFFFVEARRRDEDEWQRVVRTTAGCIGDGRDVLRVPQLMSLTEGNAAVADFLLAGHQARLVEAPTLAE